MSYDGRLGFGLLSDYDALPDLEDIAAHLSGAIDDLADAAGVHTPRAPNGRARRVTAAPPATPVVS
jgi:hypothetical protein